MITQKRLKELFDYKDGSLYHKVSRGCVSAGMKAGCIGSGGYRKVKIDRKLYYHHKLVYLYHHGYTPENDVDHINRTKDDDRIENLREVSRSCNVRNTSNISTNSSGVKGVYYHKRAYLWTASITVDGYTSHIGSSKDFMEVVCMRLAAEQCLNWGNCDSSSPAYQYVNANLRGRINKADRTNLTLGV